MSAIACLRSECRRHPKLASVCRIGNNILRLCRRAYSGPRILTPAGMRILDSPNFLNLFCGYYDHKPFKPDNERLLLVHANNQPAWQTPSPHKPTSILLVDIHSKEVVRNIGQTHAWNWQQGARALWLTHDDVIFNDFDQESQSYRARVVNVQSGRSERLPLPVQEVDSKGNVYGISYEALSAIRPDYGYRNKACADNDILNNRILVFNAFSGEQKTIIAVDDLSKATNEYNKLPLKLPTLNHLMASPSGDYLLFLFRYYLGRKRITDLYLMEVSTQDRWCIARDRGVSHCCWLNNSSVIATMQGPEGGFGYYRFDRQSASWERVWHHGDGHPSRATDHTLLTDTYPDRHGIRHLLSVPLASPDRAVRLASFPEPLLFHGQTRCDLHPSLSASGQWIQVDIARHHRRMVGLLPMTSHESGILT